MNSPRVVYVVASIGGMDTPSAHCTLEGAKARAEQMADMSKYVWRLEDNGNWSLRDSWRYEPRITVTAMEIHE